MLSLPLTCHRPKCVYKKLSESNRILHNCCHGQLFKINEALRQNIAFATALNCSTGSVLDFF